MKRVTRYFFEGLLFLVPIVVTIYVIYFIFMKIDSLFEFKVPGIGFVITLFIITAVGFVTSHYLTRRIVRSVETIFTRLPLVKMIYTSIKDLINAFVGDKKGFNKPVLVKLSPESTTQVIGFVTRESLENIGLSDSVAVYLPHSYNFSGALVIVKKEQVTPIKADSGDIMAFIVSGGIAAK